MYVCLCVCVCVCVLGGTTIFGRILCRLAEVESVVTEPPEPCCVCECVNIGLHVC